jgi:PKD repeat protein
LTRTSGLLVCGLFVAACNSPTSNTPAPPPVNLSTPAHILINFTAGTGTNGGRAEIRVTVQNAISTPLASIAVQFSTTAGELTPTSATTDDKGVATVTLSADPTDAPIVTASVGSLKSKLPIAIQAPTAAPPPATPPSTPPPTPNPPSNLMLTMPTAGTTGTAVTFTVSAPANAGPLDWTFGDGQTAYSTTHTFTTANTYNVTVNATGIGKAASGKIAIADRPAPPAPPGPSYTVTLTASSTTVVKANTSTLTADVNQQNGAPAATSYAWDCNGDGSTDATTTAPANTTICTYNTIGSFTAKVTATGGSVSGSGTVAITVTAPPVPVVAVSCNKTAAATATCVVSATVSGAPVLSANITHVDWDWGDGNATATNAPNANVTSHTYGAAAVYLVVVSNVTVTTTTAKGSGSVNADVR